MRTAVSRSTGGVPRTVEEMRARPAGARLGSTALTTAVCATGPPRSASRSRDAPVVGGSSVVWCTHRHRVEVRYAQAGQQFGGGARVRRQQDGPAADLAVLGRGHRARGDRGDPDAGVHGARWQRPRRAAPAASPHRPPADTAARTRRRAARGRRTGWTWSAPGRTAARRAAGAGSRRSCGRGHRGPRGPGRRAARAGPAAVRRASLASRASAAPSRAWSTAVPSGAVAPGSDGAAGAVRPGALARARTAWSAPLAPPAPGRRPRAMVASVAVQQDARSEGPQHERVESGCQP